MPTNVTIVQTRDFIRARPDGALDLAASRQLLVDLIAAMRGGGEHHVLIDTRAAAPTRLSRTDLWQLGVAAGTQSPFAHGRVALLVPQDEHDDAQFFEDIARVEGANIRVFIDFETAIDWLILREQPGT